MSRGLEEVKEMHRKYIEAQKAQYGEIKKAPKVIRMSTKKKDASKGSTSQERSASIVANESQGVLLKKKASGLSDSTQEASGRKG